MRSPNRMGARRWLHVVLLPALWAAPMLMLFRMVAGKGEVGFVCFYAGAAGFWGIFVERSPDRAFLAIFFAGLITMAAVGVVQAALRVGWWVYLGYALVTVAMSIVEASVHRLPWMSLLVTVCFGIYAVSLLSIAVGIGLRVRDALRSRKPTSPAESVGEMRLR